MEQFEIRLSGSGGQGLILGASVLAEALMAEGYKVAQSQAFEPVSRGGVSRSDLVVARQPPGYPLVTALDLLLVLDQPAVEVSQKMIRPGGLVLVDRQRVGQPPKGEWRLHALPLLEAAREAGNLRVANMVALGALAALGELCGLPSLRDAVRHTAPAAFVEVSLAGLEAGDAMARELSATEKNTGKTAAKSSAKTARKTSA